MEGVTVWCNPQESREKIELFKPDCPGIEEVNAFILFTMAYFKHHVRGPAWHLALAAVNPDKQRQGIGSKLIQEQLTIIDKDHHLPCYLDTQRPDDRKIYENLGFQVVDRSHTPSGLAPFYAMVRRPQ